MTAGNYYIFVGTPDQAMDGKFVKLLVAANGATLLSPSTAGSIVSPQAFVPGVAIVGAVNGSDGTGSLIEAYSGQGPINLFFPTPMQIQASEFRGS